MTDSDSKVMQLAQEFLKSKKIDIHLPGEIGEREGERVEVIFLNPFSLEPDTIVCPPDYRVWVNIKTNEVTWIVQM
jgi:hypothetical protein